MRVLALRHGQSEFNIRGLCNDDPGRNVRLTPAGREQASAAAGDLGSHPFDIAYVSPLPRAVETAKLVLAGRDVPEVIEPRLADIRSGFDGRPVASYFAAISHDPLHARINGGESLLDHKKRVLGFLGWLSGRPYESVLLVAHEETLRVFKASAEGLDDTAMMRLQFANCEDYSFEIVDGSD